MKFSVSYLPLFITTCYALTLGLPKSTSGHDLHPQGWTPRPTPAPEYKLMGREESIQSLIWAGDNTCGYLGGVQNSSYTCGGGRCAYLLSSGKPWGNIECCSTAPCSSNSFFLCVNCDFPTLACIDSVNYYTYDNCDAACQIDSYTLKCTEASEPFCNTLVYPDVTVTDIRCGSSAASTALNVSTTFLGESDRAFYTQTFISTDGGPPATIPAQGSSASDVTFTALTAGSSDSGITHASGEPSTGMASFSLANSAETSVHGTPTASSSPNSPMISNTNGTLAKDSAFGPVLGGTLGGVVLIALFTAWICSCIRRKPEHQSSQTPNLEASELEVSHPHTSTTLVFHELHEEGAPTFAWYKLWKPTFSYQTRCSDGVPDSPTLGRHARTDLLGLFPRAPSTQSIAPISLPSRQELPAENQVSPQQARNSEQTVLDRTTVSPLSACSEAMWLELQGPVINQAFHQGRLQSSDSIERAQVIEELLPRKQE